MPYSPIAPTPTAPTEEDPPNVFAVKSFALVADWDRWTADVNAAGAYFDGLSVTMEGYRDEVAAIAAAVADSAGLPSMVGRAGQIFRVNDSETGPQWSPISAFLPMYFGNAGKVLALNSGGDDLEWVTMAGEAVDLGFTGLTPGQSVRLNAGGTAMEAYTPAAEILGLEFSGLSAGFSIRLNSGGTALEAYEPIEDALDLGVTGLTAGQSVRVNSGGTALEAYTPSTGAAAASISSKTEDFTIALGEEGSHYVCDHATGLVVECPANGTAAIPVGSSFSFRQKGDGPVSFVGESGVTVNSAEGSRTDKVNSIVHVIKESATEWSLWGDLYVEVTVVFHETAEVLDTSVTNATYAFIAEEGADSALYLTDPATGGLFLYILNGTTWEKQTTTGLPATFTLLGSSADSSVVIGDNELVYERSGTSFAALSYTGSSGPNTSGSISSDGTCIALSRLDYSTGVQVFERSGSTYTTRTTPSMNHCEDVCISADGTHVVGSGYAFDNWFHWTWNGSAYVDAADLPSPLAYGKCAMSSDASVIAFANSLDMKVVIYRDSGSGYVKELDATIVNNPADIAVHPSGAYVMVAYGTDSPKLERYTQSGGVWTVDNTDMDPYPYTAANFCSVSSGGAAAVGIGEGVGVAIYRGE